MNENLVEVIEIWAPVENGGEARRDGQNLKLVAFIANGQPIKIAEGYVVELNKISETQYQNIDRPTSNL